MNYKRELQSIQDQINHAKVMEQSDQVVLGLIGSVFCIIERQLQTTVTELKQSNQRMVDHEEWHKHKG